MVQPEWITQIDHRIIKEALASNDDLGIVLRAHLELERAMIRVLEKKFPNYAALEHRSYAAHLRALRSLGAIGPIFQVADQVNKVRNEMAHVKKGGKTSLTERDVKELCSQASGAFGGYKDVLDFTLQHDEGAPKKLRDLPLRHQFFLISMLAAAAIDTIPQRELSMAVK